MIHSTGPKCRFGIWNLLVGSAFQGLDCRPVLIQGYKYKTFVSGHLHSVRTWLAGKSNETMPLFCWGTIKAESRTQRLTPFSRLGA